jgi:hydroxymethylbilane synthase
MLPAVGQGALGLECRAGDDDTLRLLERLNDLATRACVLAERAFLRGLGGGCLVPIGALGLIDGESLHLRGCVLSPDGQHRIDGEQGGPSGSAEAVGRALADDLLARGARELLV